MKRWSRRAVAVAFAAVLAGCERADEVPAAVAAVQAPIDTVQPPGIALERFRKGLTEVEMLSGGETSIDSLASRWVAAVETHDTSAIRRLVMDRSEYAWLYYPASAFAREPLYQPPEIFWFRLQATSEKGIVRVLRRLGGSDTRYRGVECPRPPRTEGANRIWEYCAVLRAEGDTVRSDVLFGGILEHGGRFKFIGYGNQY